MERRTFKASARNGIRRIASKISDTRKSLKRKETCIQKFKSCRWIIGYLCCAATFSQTAIRQLIGMATVCMTLNRDQDLSLNISNTTNGSYNVTFDYNESDQIIGEFDWSSEFEGTVLAAFNFGFIASPILGGYVAGYFGGKRVIAISLGVGALCTILTPISVRANRVLLVFMRVITGLFMGTVDPSIQHLWSKWAPIYEKSQLTTCSFSGLSIAGITTFLVSGYLCTIPLDRGWPFIFYVFGTFAFLIIFPWLYFVYDSPDLHPRIEVDEMKYINKGKIHSDKMTKPPWNDIMRSMPFWAIVVAHVNHGWTTTWVLAYLPKYLKTILEFGVQEDGVLSSVPFAGPLISGIFCGYSSDWLIRKKIFSTEIVRKLYQVVGCVGCAACFFAIGFLDVNNRTLVVCLFILGLTFQNFTTVAFRINHLDIAPKYASVLMGITVTVAMVSALSAPFITSAIIKNDTHEEWKHVFWIVASINIVGAVFYAIFAKGDIQPWACESVEEIIEPTKVLHVPSLRKYEILNVKCNQSSYILSKLPDEMTGKCDANKAFDFDNEMNDDVVDYTSCDKKDEEENCTKL